MALAISLQPVVAEFISDITTSESDEYSALQVKAELFWKPIVSAAKDIQMEKHFTLYAHAEDVISRLPEKNEYVRQTLRDALNHLKVADDASLKQAMASSRMAQDQLDAPAGQGSSGLSFLTGGALGGVFKSALQRFVGGGRYSEKLMEHVGQRQDHILPVLRGATGVTGDILSNCRLASKKSFDVRKYDIYNKGVPKTPQMAKDLADEIIEAAGNTRHQFTKSITDMVKGITRDKQEEHEDASVTVTKESLRGLHQSVAATEAKISSPSKNSPLKSQASSEASTPEASIQTHPDEYDFHADLDCAFEDNIIGL